MCEFPPFLLSFLFFASSGILAFLLPVAAVVVRRSSFGFRLSSLVSRPTLAVSPTPDTVEKRRGGQVGKVRSERIGIGLS